MYLCSVKAQEYQKDKKNRISGFIGDRVIADNRVCDNQQ
jgi:hypothetical protein